MMTKIILIIFVIQVHQIFPVDAKKHFWQGNTAVSAGKNWRGENKPCGNSIVDFEKNKILVAFLDGGLLAKSVLLPDDAIFYFDKYTILGDLPEWQCEKASEGQEVAFFESANDGLQLLNAFDVRSWKTEEKVGSRARLHAEQIPSNIDEVVFPIDAASRISLDEPLVVGSLNYSGQHLSNAKFFLTMEGQLIFDVGPGLKTRYVIDNVDYQLPNMDVIQIISGPVESRKGIKNSNSNDPQFSEICRFVTCQISTACSEAFRPIGHCCHVCGAMITFHHSNLDFETIKTNLAKIEEEKFSSDSIYFSAGLSFSRIDDGESVAKYQIVAFIDADSESEYDEDDFLDAVRKIYSIVESATDQDHKLFTNSIFGYSEVMSSQSGKIHLRSILKILLFLFLIGIVIFFYFRHLYKTNPRFRLWLNSLNSNSQNLSNRFAVVWQNANKFAEERVNIAFRRSSTPPIISTTDSEERDDESSMYHAEFRNPVFEDPKIFKSESIKEETFVNLNF